MDTRIKTIATIKLKCMQKIVNDFLKFESIEVTKLFCNARLAKGVER